MSQVAYLIGSELELLLLDADAIVPGWSARVRGHSGGPYWIAIPSGREVWCRHRLSQRGHRRHAKIVWRHADGRVWAEPGPQ